MGFGDWSETEANGLQHLVNMLNDFIVLSIHQFSFLLSSKVLWWQRGWLCGQTERNKCPPVKHCCHIPPFCYKHSMNLHIWVCCQFVFLRSKIRTAPLGEKTWEWGVLTTHENIWNAFKNSSLKATGFLKTEYPTVGSLEN